MQNKIKNVQTVNDENKLLFSQNIYKKAFKL